MDRLEREQLIERLQHDNDAARQRLAEQERQREQDPALMQDHLLAADVRATFNPGDLMFTAPTSGEDEGAPAGAPYTRKTDPRRRMVFKTREDAQAPAGVAVQAPSDGNATPLYGRDGTFTRQLGMLVAEMRREWRDDLVERDRKIAELEAENREIKGLLADALKHSDQSTKAIANLARDVVAETRDREALFGALDKRFGELQAWCRGFAKDYWSNT